MQRQGLSGSGTPYDVSGSVWTQLFEFPKLHFCRDGDGVGGCWRSKHDVHQSEVLSQVKTGSHIRFEGLGKLPYRD